MAAKLRRARAVPKLVYRKANKVAVHLLGPVLLRPKRHALELEKLGMEQEGWTVPVNRLDESSVCYCVGVGVDAGFDFALVDRFKCCVFSFDPTPASTTYMQRADYDRALLRFLPVGIWDEDTDLRLYLPPNDETLLSVYDLKGTGKYVVCKCQKLSTIMRNLGHKHIDLLKLDIEGAWHKVIRNIADEKISISMLCVELDSPTSLLWVFRVIRTLRRLGLELVHFEKDNYLFVQRHMLVSSAPHAGLSRRTGGDLERSRQQATPIRACEGQRRHGQSHALRDDGHSLRSVDGPHDGH